MLGDLLTFHHIGLAAADPAAAVEALTALGYVAGPEVHDPLQNVRLVMCTHATAPDTEVIAPTDTPGPLDNILSNARTAMYHTCYSTSDLDGVLEAFEAKGLRVVPVSEPTPAILFENHPVSFYMIREFGLIEILELPAQ